MSVAALDVPITYSAPRDGADAMRDRAIMYLDLAHQQLMRLIPLVEDDPRASAIFSSAMCAMSSVEGIVMMGYERGGNA